MDKRLIRLWNADFDKIAVKMEKEESSNIEIIQPKQYIEKRL
jgi:hypothetical protein